MATGRGVVVEDGGVEVLGVGEAVSGVGFGFFGGVGPEGGVCCCGHVCSMERRILTDLGF